MKHRRILAVFLVLSLVLAMAEFPVAAADLPEGYTRLDFLDGMDGAYIDTGLTAKPEDKIVVQAAALTDSTHSIIGSGSTSTASDRIQAHYVNGSGYTLRFLGAMSTYLNLSASSKVTFTLDLRSGEGYINGKLVLEQSAEVLPTDNTIYLFTKNINGKIDTKYTDDTRIYAYQHYRNGVLVRDMIPCLRRSDGAYGMYDRVQKKFYTNAGAGSFSCDTLGLTGHGGIVMNMETGEIYYGKNIHWKNTMASTTKIMTCIVALENLDLDDRTLATISSDIVAGGSVMGLAVGESLTVRNALYGLMLPSGCDAAQLLARTAAGSYDAFIKKMNAKAAELGMTDTHYSNTSGVSSTNHYTTVYDMTKLMRYAMENETFRKIVSTKTYQIKADGKGGRAHNLTNTNKLLGTYEGYLGGKTGTNSSGAHLIAAAERHGSAIVAMILDSDTAHRYSDVTKLLDYGFTQTPDHVYASVVTDPSCTELGFTTYTCTYCGDSYTDGYVNALGHAYGEWYTVKPAACCETGLQQRDCARCDAFETEEIAATEHEYESVVTDPTCTEQGFTTYTCTVCGETYTDAYVDALGHEFGEWYTVKEATCSEPGLQQRDCARCDAVESEEIAAAEHEYAPESVVTAPTCTEQGFTTYTCTVCGETVVDTYVDALGHEYGEWYVVKEATCSEPGLQQRDCTRCGAVETEEIAAAPHEYESVVTDPTCTEQGFTTYTCTVCGETVVDTYVDALGHDYGEWYVVKAATCSETGLQQRDCARCGAVETEEIAAVPHAYESVVTDPTCTEQGFTTHTCTVCGDTYADAYVDALGHDYVDGVCTRCGDILPAEVASGQSGETTWSLMNNGVLTISGTGAMENYITKTQMPWYEYRDQIVKVVVEDGVTSIGDYAFYGMPALETVLISETVTTVGHYAFKNSTALTAADLPDGLTQLGESAFYGCSSLTAIDIPAGLWTVQPYTFKNCTALAEVTFHEGNLQKISDGAFYNTGLTSLVLPECLDILDSYTFKNCAQLADIHIPSGLTEIREAAFYGTAVVNLTIPEGIAEIDGYAFKKCEQLKTVSLPATLQIIGESAFMDCVRLSWMDIPEGVTTIGGYAFKRCKTMSDLTLPSTLTEIGDSAFHSCYNLTAMRIPENVEKIGEYCFSNMTMKEIVFTGDAPAIGTGAFNRITANAYYPGMNPTWTEEVRQQYGGTITWIAEAVGGTCGDDLTWSLLGGVLTISGTGDMYDYGNLSDSASPWYSYRDAVFQVIIEAGATSVGNYAFYECENLAEVSIPDGVTNIGKYAFRGAALRELEIPASVADIGRNAFAVNREMTAVVLHEGLAAIGIEAFSNCSGLVEMTVPESVTSIGRGAFSACEALGSVVLPAGLTEIADFTFSFCTNLTDLEIPAGVTSIGASAFEACDSLTELVLPEGLTAISHNLVCSCDALKSLTIPASVTCIYNSAFASSGLEEVIFLGDAPVFDESNSNGFSPSIFLNVTATVYYPADNPTWTAEVMQQYNGTLTWVAR